MGPIIIEEVLAELGVLGGAARSNADVLTGTAEELAASSKRTSDAISDGVGKFGDSIKKHLDSLQDVFVSFTKIAAATFSQSLTQQGAMNTSVQLIKKTGEEISKLTIDFPMIGKMAAALGVSAAELSATIGNESIKMINSFNKISGSGVFNQFSDLAMAIDRTGLELEELERIIGKNTESFAQYQSTSEAGGKLMTKIIENNKKNEKEFLRLGFSVEEFNDSLLRSAKILIKAGFDRSKGDIALADAAREAVLEIDALAKATGRSRTDILDQQEKLQGDVRYRAFESRMQSMGKEGEKIMSNMNFMIAKFQGPIGESLRNLTISGGIAQTKQEQQIIQMLMLSGKDPYKLFRGFKSGEITGEAFTNAIQEMAKGGSKFLEQGGKNSMLELFGGSLFMTEFYAELKNLEQYGTTDPKAIAKIKGKQAEIMEPSAEGPKTREQQLNEAATEYQAAARELSRTMRGAVIESFNLIITANNKLTGELNTITKTLVDKFKSSETVKNLEKTISKEGFAHPAVDAGTQAGATTAAAVGIFSGIGALGLGALSVANPTLLPATLPLIADLFMGGAVVSGLTSLGILGLGKAAHYGLEKLGVKQHNPSESKNESKNIDELFDFRDSAATNRLDNMDEAFKKNLVAAANEYSQANPGKKIIINSAYRDEEMQQRLWDSAKEIPGKKGRFIDGRPVAIPGRSLHQSGLAVDIVNHDAAGLEGILSKYGIVAPLSNDRPHFQSSAMPAQMAKGGIVTPTPGGSIINVAEAGQSEAVIPMPDGRSIPVTFKNSNEQSTILISSFDKMSSKLDTMIDLLSRGNKLQNSIARNTA